MAYNSKRMTNVLGATKLPEALRPAPAELARTAWEASRHAGEERVTHARQATRVGSTAASYRAIAGFGLNAAVRHRNSSSPSVFQPVAADCGRRTKYMKRAIAGILLLVGMSVAPALAWDGDRGLHRDIRHDEVRIAHDRYELRRDLNHGNYAAARHERRDLRREYRDVNRDRRELGWR